MWLPFTPPIAYNEHMNKPKQPHFEGQRAVLDRFEEGLAVLTGDDGADFSARREDLPSDARPGDSFAFREGRWVALPEETEARRLRIAEKRRRLFREE